jgi:predicted nucleotidyltransferase
MKAMSDFSYEYFGSDEFPALFAALKRTFDAAEVPFYLIGARARDVWFLPEKSFRITLDIDWIAASEDEGVFQDIRDKLVKVEGFQSTQNPFTMLSPKGTEVDILPFFKNTGQGLAGLREVYERGIQGVTFDDNATYQVATLPAIVLLKFIAWDDRPEYRLKDLWDIWTICENYFDQFSEDIYDNHHDLFENRELIEIAAYVIGRKMKFIIGDSEHLRRRIITILTGKDNEIAQYMSIKSAYPEEQVNQVLINLLDGILDESGFGANLSPGANL